MKIIHVLKKIEQIDEDIKELRKMEKALQRNKSFTTPIFMTIEKQVNILLGDRIKLLELKVENPPAFLTKDFEDDSNDSVVKPLRNKSKKQDKKIVTSKKKGISTNKTKTKKLKSFDDEIPMLTQDMIDSRINSLGSKSEKKKENEGKLLIDRNNDDKDVKLLDIALEKGTLNKEMIDKEKKKIRFFRNNFPGGEY